MRRFCTLLVTLVLLLCLLALGVQAADEPDYTKADQIFSGLYSRLVSKKTPADIISTDAAEDYLQNAPNIAPDTLRRHGDELTWETTDGIACRFSPEIYALAAKKHTAAQAIPSAAKLSAIKSTDKGRDVCLIAPYYGLDEDFGGLGGAYDNWGQVLASFTGGTYTLLTQTDATIDALAEALESCAVVLIDSHGQINDEKTTSYICLDTREGLTLRDYQYDPYIHGYHAAYSGTGPNGMIYCHVDGTAIANHMDRPAPDSLLWNGTCYGMTTQGISAPLMKKGVAAVYGYSLDVTFDADKYWMSTVMDQLTNGKTLAQAVAEMKNTWGCWDFSLQLSRVCDWDPYWICRDIRRAKELNAAFPVVVSQEDAYPADPNGLQTVKSGWQLPRRDFWLRFAVPDGVKCPDILGYMFYHGYLTTPSGKPRDESHSYTFAGWSLSDFEDTLSAPAELFKAGSNFSFGYNEPGDPLAFGQSDVTLYAVYIYEEGGEIWYTSQIPDGVYDPYDPSALFSDMPYGTWYYASVRYALSVGLVNGYTDGTFRPTASIRRSEVVTILYRMSGSPEPNVASSFSDVPAAAWYSDAVSWAVENGLVFGYSDVTFKPDLPINRSQMATVLWRYAGLPEPTGDIDSFPDWEGVSLFARDSMRWAVENKLINGNLIDGQVYLQPINPTTRAQFVTIMQRYLNTEQ